MVNQMCTTNSEEYFFDIEGCYIEEVSNDSTDSELSIAKVRVEVGVTTNWHKLRGTTERYYIVSGTGVVEVGDAPPRQVATGDIVVIPSMARQRISNNGNEDLIFLALCTPRFELKNYQNAE